MRELMNIRNIVKIYGEKRAVNGVNLTVHHGELVTIMGGSGSGKSTLAKIMCLLERPEDGDVVILGKSFARMKRKSDGFRAKNIGFVQSRPEFVHNLTLAENIALPLAAVGMAAPNRLKKAHEVMSVLGIRMLAGAYPQSVQPYKRALAGLARAIVANPALIICDEPTHTLTKIEGDNLLGYIKSYCNESRAAVLFTTMDSAFSEKIYFMEDGHCTDEVSR